MECLAAFSRRLTRCVGDALGRRNDLGEILRLAVHARRDLFSIFHDVVLMRRLLGNGDDIFCRRLRGIRRLIGACRQFFRRSGHLLGGFRRILDHLTKRRHHLAAACLQIADLIGTVARGQFMREIAVRDETDRSGEEFERRDRCRQEIIGDAPEERERDEADRQDHIRHARRGGKRFLLRHFDDDMPAGRADGHLLIELRHAVELRLEHLGLLRREACGEILVLAALHLIERRVGKRELLVVDEFAVRSQDED